MIPPPMSLRPVSATLEADLRAAGHAREVLIWARR